MPATCTTPAPRHALHRGLAALALCCAMAVAGCAPQGGTPPDRARRDLAPLAPAKSFARAHPVAPARANADIARDFLDLHFRLESGTELAVFSRFEGPITLRVTGRPSAGLMRDLEALIARLRREAGLRISLTTAEDANITIEAVSRKAIRQASPRAACFVVPNVTSLKEFRRNKRRPATNWANLRQRTRLAIFVPNDVSAQETRDCLHEEIAQAIGPLNDLYRLSDSVFNDDNVHTVLTGFDMLILRATYAPELRTGMRRAEVAARLPAILARMNPAGHNRAARPLPATPRSWIRATEGALSPARRVWPQPIAGPPLRAILAGRIIAAPSTTIFWGASCNAKIRFWRNAILKPRSAICRAATTARSCAPASQRAWRPSTSPAGRAVRPWHASRRRWQSRRAVKMRFCCRP